MNNHFPIATALALAGFVAACAPAAQNDADTSEIVGSAPTATAAPAAAMSHAEWAGKWIGVEGMFVKGINLLL